MNKIADELASLARELEATEDPQAVLVRTVHAAVYEVPGARYAGVTMIGPDGADSPATTDDIVTRVDALQYAHDEGPCLAAISDQLVVRVHDLADAPQWPRFGPAAVAEGVRSMLSFRLFVHAGTVGALNLYAEAPGAFPDDAEDIGAPLAAHAAVALVSTRERAQLKVALDNRDVIGQAKGILMERYRLTARQAFDLLILASQRRNVKLREIAEELSTTGVFSKSG